MTPKTFVETKICHECGGDGCFPNEEGERAIICPDCEGEGYVETTVTCDAGLPEVNPSA